MPRAAYLFQKGSAELEPCYFIVVIRNLLFLKNGYHF